MPYTVKGAIIFISWKKEAIIFIISCKKQLWGLTLAYWVTVLGSAWMHFWGGWVFYKTSYHVQISWTKVIFIQSLENSLDGQLKVIHGDFFRLDPLAKGALKPPALSSDKLFETMGVAAVPWRAGKCWWSHMLQTRVWRVHRHLGRTFGICFRYMFYLIHMLIN